MEVLAIAKYVRMSAMKARDVSKEIQGLPVSQALNKIGRASCRERV